MTKYLIKTKTKEEILVDPTSELILKMTSSKDFISLEEIQ